jgi:thiamine transporter
MEPDPDNAGGGNDMKAQETSSDTKVLVEIIVFSALSAALYAVRPFTLPFGGSITLGSMVPVMWLSLRRGFRIGMITGAIFGGIALFEDLIFVGAANIIATPLQAALEYPIAFGVIGLTGLFRNKSAAVAVAGAGFSVFIRFLIHYFVGVFVWANVYSFPPEWGLWLWPAVYNGSFLAVEFIICAILLFALVKKGTLQYRL